MGPVDLATEQMALPAARMNLNCFLMSSEEGEGQEGGQAQGDETEGREAQRREAQRREAEGGVEACEPGQGEEPSGPSSSVSVRSGQLEAHLLEHAQRLLLGDGQVLADVRQGGLVVLDLRVHV